MKNQLINLAESLMEFKTVQEEINQHTLDCFQSQTQSVKSQTNSIKSLNASIDKLADGLMSLNMRIEAIEQVLFEALDENDCQHYLQSNLSNGGMKQ